MSKKKFTNKLGPDLPPYQNAKPLTKTGNHHDDMEVKKPKKKVTRKKSKK